MCPLKDEFTPKLQLLSTQPHAGGNISGASQQNRRKRVQALKCTQSIKIISFPLKDISVSKLTEAHVILILFQDF